MRGESWSAGRTSLRWAAALAAAAIALHFALYASSFENLFTYDDRRAVVADPDVAGTGSLLHVFGRPYVLGRGQNFSYRPVMLLSLGLDARLFGLSPGAMRIENVVWAGLGAGIFAALAGLLGLSRGGALAIVALLTCHPIRSEAILTAVGRGDLLAFTLVACALSFAVLAWHSSRPLAWAAASGVALLLALGSKETAYAAPLVLAAALVLDHRRAPVRIGGIVAVAASWTFAFVLSTCARLVVLGGWLKGAGARIEPIENPLVALAPGERLHAAVSLLGVAFSRLLFPVQLVGDYGSHAFGSEELAGTAPFAAGVLALLLSGLAVLLLARHAPLVAFGAFFVLATYLPFANLVFVTGTAFAERLLYMPAAGVALAAAAALATLDTGRATRTAAIALVVALAALGAVRVAARIPEWRDDETLFRSVVRDRPGNGRAWFNLALIDLSRRDARGAERDLALALKVEPSLRGAAEALATHAARIGRPEEEAAIRRALASGSELPEGFGEIVSPRN